MSKAAMAEEDPFANLRNSSPVHAAIITPDGVLILSVLVSGDESLIAFQPVALKALEIAGRRGNMFRRFSGQFATPKNGRLEPIRTRTQKRVLLKHDGVDFVFCIGQA